MKEYKNIAGVYLIKSLTTGDSYIGASVCMYSRWKQHLSELKRKKHFSHKLQELYDANGKSNLVFGVIKVVDSVENLKVNERRYIARMKPTLNFMHNVEKKKIYTFRATPKIIAKAQEKLIRDKTTLSEKIENLLYEYAN